MDAATIEREALTLTMAERAVLVDRLLRTLDQEDVERMEQWGLEADQRLEAFERGEMDATTGSEVVTRIRRQLRWHSRPGRSRPPRRSDFVQRAH